MYEQIRSNKIRSWFLVVIIALLLFTVGYTLGAAWLGVENNGGLAGLGVAAVVWMILTLVAYFKGDSVVLGMSRAKRIEKKDHPRLFNVVEEIAIASGQPPPKVYIIDEPALNAFATGRKPETASVAVTRGLLNKLNRDELQGVVAHEMSHIKNRDVLFMTMIGIMVGSLVLMCDLYLRHMFRFGHSRRYRRSSKNGANAIFLAISLVVAIAAPILARLMYLAISRKREYLADASGVEMTRYPEGLASALEKIGGDREVLKVSNRATAGMFIVNPIRKLKASARGLFSTHPPLAERIHILRSMGGGASLANYDAAWRRVSGKKRGLMSRRTLEGAKPVTAREGKAAESPRKEKEERVRETTDLLRKLSLFLFMTCPCGVKLKIPPSYKDKPSVKCPRCSRVLPMALATTLNEARGERAEKRE